MDDSQMNCRCPHCYNLLTIKRLPEQRILANCPCCGNAIIVDDYGATLRKPTVYFCPKCHKKHYYDGRPPYVFCDGCKTMYVTSEKDNFLLEADIYEKGEKGELPFTKKPDKVIAARNKWRRTAIWKKALLLGSVAAVIAIIIGLYIGSLPPDITTSEAYAQMDEFWQEFRDKNPYAHQSEGIRKFEDGSYLVLISEPAEHVTFQQLEELFKPYNATSKLYKKSIGYDGWLKDAVFAINDIKEKEIPKLESKLSCLLYRTDYKAGLMDLDVIPEHIPFSSSDLNIEVTEEELRKWFIEDNESLVWLEDTSMVVSFNSVMNQGKGMKLYMSLQPGFIVWAMDQGEQDEEAFSIAARKFALDSDLILGAIVKNKRVVIIARERCVPVYELPPMRVETLRLLASTSADELSQSYERTTLFAGKLPGGKDYAPIYLSDELWHTEYGNILNVTDQMLKSWSENGMIDYVDFNYPKPVNWAFQKGALGDLDVSELTYNWNTAGVGYIVEDEGFSIYALNRTGSLPVSYIPGNSEGISEKNPVYEAEQNAYDFFSSLSSPELVKVVQYAAMYQIFRNLEIQLWDLKRGWDENAVFMVPSELKRSAQAVLDSLYHFGDSQRRKIAAHFNVPLWEKKAKVKSDEFAIDVSDGYKLGFSKGVSFLTFFQCLDFLESMESIHQALSKVSSDETLKNSLAQSLLDRSAAILYTSSSYPQITLPSFPGIGPRKSHEELVSEAVSAVQGAGFSLQKYAFIISGLDITHCRDLYVEANAAKSRTWMKCPTIVESWSLRDSINSIGGHNLDSKVSSFKVSKDLKPGQTRKSIINGKEVVEISAYDRQAHITDQGYLRKVGRLGNSEIRGPEVITRSKLQVMSPTRGRTARGFNVTDHQSPIKVKMRAEGGCELNGRRYVDFEEFLKDVGTSIEEGQAHFKQIEIEGLKGAGVDVDVFIDGVAGKLRKGNCSSIPMSQYDFAHKTVVYEGDKAIITIPIKPGRITFGSTSEVVQAGMGGSTVMKPVVPIKGGKVDFSVPKSKSKAFVEFIDNFLKKQKGYWNEFRIKAEMKRRGISPEEASERTLLRVARLIIDANSKEYVWMDEAEAVA